MPGRRVFIATAQAWDDEMRARIARHRADRGADFETVEAPLELEDAVRAARDASVVVIDCLTLWLTNVMLAEDAPSDDAIAERMAALTDSLAAHRAPVYVVTNEVGMGIVPENALARRFRDVAGRAHQALAARADGIFLAALGVVLRVHPGPVEVARAGG